MEHESFSDREVAEVMNKDFISIKVDREERPDIDQVYMNACVLMTGQGGWPLNIVALPDGRPVFAGTYFPKKSWISILEQILDLRENNIEKLVKVAESVVSGIENENIQINSAQNNENGRETFIKTGKKILEDIDLQYGGFMGAPKFPLPSALKLLADQFIYTSDDKFFNALKITLDKIAFGGIYDHIGGGFARYSTDREWRIPHFEKMLYDNGQLLSVYSEGYKITGSEIYKDVVYETVKFLLRDLFAGNKESGVHGFYSSLDADSEGIEGKYYVWKSNEIKSAAGDNFIIIKDLFNISESGNWEKGNNILFRTFKNDEYLEKFKMTSESLEFIVSEFKKKLFQIRDKRIKPGLDRKIITSWNSLTVSGLIDSYTAFNEKSFKKHAGSCLEFLEDKMISSDGNIFRIFDPERMLPSIHGFLDDFAFTIEAMIKFYQITFEENWLSLAESLLKYTLDHFLNKEGAMFYYKSDIDKKLITRSYEIQDNVIPSSNSVMAANLFNLGVLMQNSYYTELSENMVNSIAENIGRSGIYFSRWCSLLGIQINGSFEIVITGDSAHEFRDQINRHFLPGAIFLGGEKGGTLPLLKDKNVDGKTMIYICKDRVCRFPSDNVNEALSQLKIG